MFSKRKHGILRNEHIPLKKELSHTTLYYISLFIGLFFCINGVLKIHPKLHKISYKAIVLQFKNYHKKVPFINERFATHQEFREFTGYNELIGGLVLVFLPEKQFLSGLIKNLATFSLFSTMLLNAYARYLYSTLKNTQDQPDYYPSLALLLAGKLLLNFTTYYTWWSNRKICQRNTARPITVSKKVHFSDETDGTKEGKKYK